MNWIDKYRLDQSFFNRSDKYKEILRLIKNHDIQDSKRDVRECKISHLFNESYNDPLLYLDPIIDILEDKIERCLELPTGIVSYIQDRGGGDSVVKQKYIHSSLSKFASIDEFKELIDEKKKEGFLICPYKIYYDSNILYFRGGMFLP